MASHPPSPPLPQASELNLGLSGSFVRVPRYVGNSPQRGHGPVKIWELTNCKWDRAKCPYSSSLSLNGKTFI